MAPLTKFLYRMLRSNCKAIFLPNNRAFLQSSLDSCHEHIMLLSRGYPISKEMLLDPRGVLETAFREGTEDDIQVLFSILPSLLRYTRAANLIEQHHRELALCKKREKKFDNLEYPSTLPGALLISKLYYSEKDLARRSLASTVKNGIEELAATLKLELEKTLLERQKLEKLSCDNGNKSDFPKLTIENKRRSMILALCLALDKMILLLETRRLRDGTAEREHLVDQVILPDGAYSSAAPITYSVLYSSVINSIQHLHLEAVGISFPQMFLTRIIAKSPVKNLHHESKPLSSEDFLKSGPAQFSRRRDLKNVPKEINFVELLGNWVGFYSAGMKEVRLRYNKNTRILEAVRIDGDQHLPAGEIAWRIDLNTICKKSNLLAINKPYDVTVQIAQNGFTNARYVPYTLTLEVLPASLFQPASHINLDSSAHAPYIEIQLNPALEKIEEEITTKKFAMSESQSNNSTVAAMRAGTGSGGAHSGHAPLPVHTIARTDNGPYSHPSLHSHSHSHFHSELQRGSGAAASEALSMRRAPRRRADVRAATSSKPGTISSSEDLADSDLLLERLIFCRTVDLDRCLLSISDRGVVPLTPTTYLRFMREHGKDADRLPEIITPATNNMVTCRMAGNLANMAAYAEPGDRSKHDDAAFWIAVRRFFDEKAKSDLLS